MSEIGAVTNIIISKIESKSQQKHLSFRQIVCCNKYHYFKDRKQITTYVCKRCRRGLAVTNIIISKIESKSQRNSIRNKPSCAVTNIIISKIESKSQLLRSPYLCPMRCNKYHYFKDRKQITTNSTVITVSSWL